jgi:Tol biopolymer transport system component
MRSRRTWQGRVVRTIETVAVMAACGAVVGPPAARAVAVGATDRVSVSSTGVQANGESHLDLRPDEISADGRFVAFVANASNLVPGDTNKMNDVFVRDLAAGTTDRVSLSSTGGQGNGHSFEPSLSADGRFVAFASSATNLVPGDTNNRADVFVRDRQLGTTERVSVSTAGGQADARCTTPAISATGRFVVFQSISGKLVAGDTNTHSDIFVHDRATGRTTRVSISSTRAQANSASIYPSISDDGRYVAFVSRASNLVSGDTNRHADMFVRDRARARTGRVSISSSRRQGNGDALIGMISGNGLVVAFESDATNLVPGDTNGVPDIFVRNRAKAVTRRASVSASGVQTNAEANNPAVSADGTRIAFHSNATNLVRGDTNGTSDVFVRDRLAGTTRRVSVTSAGGQADDGSLWPGISDDGRLVPFISDATNLVPGDTNMSPDVFVHALP